ncbi:hypothetical protein, partial [Mycoplasma marinum]
AFMSPQFNIYNYKNYQSNNSKINTDGAVLTVKKLGVTVNAHILEFIKNITKDPYSNYTFSVLELLKSANIDEIIKKIKI